MHPERTTETTDALRDSDAQAISRLYEEVYEELHAIAARHRRSWSGNETLDTTSLLHESFVKLAEREKMELTDRSHLLAVAARAMRHILIDYAKQRGAKKRGGDRHRVEWEDVHAAMITPIDTLLGLAAGLERLSRIDPRRASVFELRFFFGLSVREASELLSISPATVKRDWTLAATFLRIELGQP